MTKNLQIGLLVKNYLAMCLLLDEPEKEGKSKILQLENWKRYFDWDKQGHKFIITVIYDIPLPKVDNRGKSEGSRNKGIYAQYVDNLLMEYLMDTKHVYENTVYTTNNKIAESIGIVNYNYRTALSNQEKFYNTIKDDFGIYNNVYCMYDTINLIKTKVREVIKSSLDRLVKLKYIEYNYVNFVFVGISRPVYTYEKNKIEELEKVVLVTMGKSQQQIDNNNKLSKQFRDRILYLMQENYPYIQNIYKGYVITIKDSKNIDFEFAQIYKLNQLILDSLKDKPAENLQKFKEKDKITMWFGRRNPFWKKWTFDRMSKNYLRHCDNFIRMLVDITSPNITERIVECENDTVINYIETSIRDKIVREVEDDVIRTMGL